MPGHQGSHSLEESPVTNQKELDANVWKASKGEGDGCESVDKFSCFEIPSPCSSPRHLLVLRDLTSNRLSPPDVGGALLHPCSGPSDVCSPSPSLPGATCESYILTFTSSSLTGSLLANSHPGSLLGCFSVPQPHWILTVQTQACGAFAS